MREKRFHELIEAQDSERKKAVWTALNKKLFEGEKDMAKKYEVIYLCSPRPEKKKRHAGRVIAFILALLIAAGIVLVGYCARVDGVWYANNDITTWRWGGIWTEEETPGAALGGMHTLADKLESDHHAAPLTAGGGIGGGPVGGGLCTNCQVGTTSAFATIIKAATCTEAGEKGYKCSHCSYVSGKTTIPALGHNYIWTITSTTTESYTCTRCNDVSETRAHTHAYAWTVTIEPTQESEGEESYKCACGDMQETRVLPKLATPVELPEDPTKEGYTFTGWFFDEACTQPYDGRVIYEDTVLYAGWKINTFTVTFDSKGGGDVPAQTVDWNTAATLSEPERLGYKFLGWYLSDDVQYEGAGITENVTLTAHWERAKCTVSFYVDGALYTTMTVDYGTPLVQAAEAAGLFEQNITSYAFMNGEEVSGELSNVKITDDMTVSADEPTEQDRIAGFWVKYWLYVACIGAGGVALLLLFFAVKPRKR